MFYENVKKYFSYFKIISHNTLVAKLKEKYRRYILVCLVKEKEGKR
jgi:hypothetical protein